MKPRNRSALLTLLVLTSFGLHALTITEPLWLDEAISVKQAQGTVPETISLVSNDVHTPLYHILLSLWIDATSTTPWVVRLLSTTFSVLTIYASYRLGADHFTEQAGLITAALLTTTEAVIHYGQEARPYSLLLFLAVISTYTYLSLRETQRWGAAFTYAAVNTLLLYTHIFGSLLLLAHFLHHSLNKETIWQATDTRLAGSAVMTTVLFSPWLPTLVNQIKGNSLTWLPRPGLEYVFDSYAVLLGTPAALITAVAVIVWTRPKNQLLLLWGALPPIALILASFAIKPAFHHRYILFTLPALYLLLAKGIKNLSSDRAKTILLTLLLLTTAISPLYPNTLERDHWDEIAGHLAENRPVDQPILIYPNYHQDPLTYTYNPSCFKQRGIYSCNANTKNIYALGNNATCCNDSSSLLKTNTTLGDITDHPYWVLDIRQPQNTHDKPLIDYLNTTHGLTLNTTFTGGIALYTAR